MQTRLRLTAMASIPLALLAATSVSRARQQAPLSPRTPLPYVVPAQMPDKDKLAPLDGVHLEGYLGDRVTKNERNRLLQVDMEPLLAGYRHRPGNHPWIGEHVGKWLHAATLAWVNTGDSRLRAKMDGVVTDLIATQEADGYLGTYTPEKRFGLYPEADWDVWSHKYNMIGLLTYYRYTGSRPALVACRKMGDLLLTTFGLDKKSILAAGTHIGMAATSVLEPIVLLYRTTGDSRYLDFARYIVSVWDEPNGPRVLSTLATTGKVNQTANGKSYEMLSNLVGLCELARVTGDTAYLKPVTRAWEDIVANQLYITGTTSYGEHFHADHDLPNVPGANIGETCVTVTWIQLNAQLLQLTGEARYGNELERSYYNHLAAAQRPDGAEWCYYTALEGRKPYGPGISCCVSSGPRGMAMLPELAYLTQHEGNQDSLVVNLFEPSRATVMLGGQPVTIEQRTNVPRAGHATLIFHTTKPVTFGVKVRAPEWAQPMTVQMERGKVEKGWLLLPPKSWKEGDKVEVSFPLGPRQISGTYGNMGRTALQWGPLVLALDSSRNPNLASPTVLALVGNTPFSLSTTSSGSSLTFAARVRTSPTSTPQAAVFVPFADAGGSGGSYRIWLRAPGNEVANISLLLAGRESRSRQGNVSGAINDADPSTFVVTFDGTHQREDWFAVQAEHPVTLNRVVYHHGNTFHDGGWFDTTAGKPRIEIRRTPTATWEPIGALEDYPATTATDAKGLQSGQAFTLRLAQPVTVVALRVVGTPASGDNPKQAFSSCAELEAF